MRIALTLILIVILSGCAGTRHKVGISLHSNSLDAPEYTTKNPQGIYRAEKDFEPFELFFEHESMIFMRERGLGYNKVGALIELETIGNWIIGREQK